MTSTTETSNLVAIGFDDELQADKARKVLEAMTKEHLVDVQDAVVVVKNSEGELKVNQKGGFAALDPLNGALLGLLIGAAIVLEPWLGLVAGAVGGTFLQNNFAIEGKFIQKLSQTLPEGSSGLFILVRNAETDKLLEELKEFKGKILKTSLSEEEEAKLEAVSAKTESTLV